MSEKYGSGLDHFKHSKARPDFDILGSEFRLEGPNVFRQPFLERHIVGIASQKGHGGMRMAVIKRRYKGQAIALDNFGIFVITGRKGTPNLREFLPRNQDILLFTLK